MSENWHTYIFVAIVLRFVPKEFKWDARDAFITCVSSNKKGFELRKPETHVPQNVGQWIILQSKSVLSIHLHLGVIQYMDFHDKIFHEDNHIH